MKKDTEKKKRVVIAITGASGIVLGMEVLKLISMNQEWESHVIISEGAKRTMELETNFVMKDFENISNKIYSNGDIGASIASGTYETEGMIIVPCSMKTVAGISSGYSENLILRAADVSLKERKKLVLAVRESPLNRIHLRNMLEVTDAGAIVMPTVPAYYTMPDSVEAVNRQIACRLLAQLGISVKEFIRWGD